MVLRLRVWIGCQLQAKELLSCVPRNKMEQLSRTGVTRCGGGEELDGVHGGVSKDIHIGLDEGTQCLVSKHNDITGGGLYTCADAALTPVCESNDESAGATLAYRLVGVHRGSLAVSRLFREGTLGSYCIRHPDRLAERSCARCGDFICSGCVVSGDICTVCKSRLFREGVPYSAAEKARAISRRCRRLSERMLQAMLALAGLAVLIQMGTYAFFVPRAMAWLPTALGLCSVLAGLAAAILAGVGLRQSNLGRPGPALPGVFPRGYAIGMIVLALMPAMMALAWLLSSLLP